MSERKRHAPSIPDAVKLAYGIRHNGATLDGLAFKYDCTTNKLRKKLNDAGYSSVTGEATVIPIKHRESPLHLSAGGSAQYVGGGDNDHGLPTEKVIYKQRKPTPTGLDWKALRPSDEPLTPSPPEVRMTGSGHTFAIHPDWAELEALRGASLHQHAPAGSGDDATTDDTYDASKHGRRLTDAQRAAIVHRYKMGESAISLGKALGVSDSAILYTLRRAGCPIRSRSEAMRLVYQ